MIPSVFEIENSTSTYGLMAGTGGVVRIIGSLIPVPQLPVPGGDRRDVDDFVVPISAGQVITTELDSLSGLQPTLSILDPNGNVIGATTVGNRSYLQTAQLTTPGNYIIRVTSNSGVLNGRYQLFINNDFTVDTAEPYPGVLQGDETSNLLVGRGGYENGSLISGQGGDDVLIGRGGGFDQLMGGNGDDFFVLREGDTVAGRITARTFIDGGPGVDTAQYIYTTGAYAVSLGTANTGPVPGKPNLSYENGQLVLDNAFITGVEYIGVQATSQSDASRFWIGSSLAAAGLLPITPFASSSLVILGNNSADTVLAGIGHGADPEIQLLIDAGLGNDVIYAGSGNDQLDGGSPGLRGQFYLDGGNDYIDGGAGNDVIEGRDGADTMVGGLGDDNIFVDSQYDLVIELPNEGIDTIWVSGRFVFDATVFSNVENIVANGNGPVQLGGSLGNEYFIGSNQGDIIFAGAGDDVVFGHAGNDLIEGSAGNDYMSGGAGADTFNELGAFGVDVITDFQDGVGGDVIRITAFSSFAQMQSQLFQVDADGDSAIDDAYIIVSPTNTLTLLNTVASSLSSANFSFV